jgi:hypothetical protein
MSAASMAKLLWFLSSNHLPLTVVGFTPARNSCVENHFQGVYEKAVLFNNS